MTKKHQISFPTGVVNDIDKFVKESERYLNRSHFVAEACEEKLKCEKKK